MRSFLTPTVFTASVLLSSCLQSWAAHPSQGLWVGEVALNAVNEATGAVGDSNTYEFTDPQLVTPTSDTAYLRLIFHVNGAGQAQLLKSVAVVDAGTSEYGDLNVKLITDPKLYSEYPGIAKRYASAFYDFGNVQTVSAIDEIIDVAVARAVSQVGVNPQTDDEETAAALLAIESYVLEGSGGLNEILGGADVATAYLDSGSGASSFITSDFYTLAEALSVADEVANLINTGPSTAADFAYTKGVTYAPFPGTSTEFANFNTVMTAAVDLRDESLFGDTRGIDAIAGVIVAAANAVAETDAAADISIKQANARAAVIDAWHNAADVDQAYNRFLASADFVVLPTFIVDVVVDAALIEVGRSTDPADIILAIQDALIAEDPVSTADAAAVSLQSASLFGDPRAVNALSTLVNQTAEAAAAQVLVSTDRAALTELVEAAASNAFASIQAAPVFESAPTDAYSTFVVSSDYSSAATTAASVAASEVVFQIGAGVTDPVDLEFFARRAVNKALIGVRNNVATLPQNSVLFSGDLEPSGTIEGELFLPALAPTNPFMHRLHPDHTAGYPITRKISLSVNAATDASGLDRVGYGVSRLTGTYNEEIFGLHKPLGNNQDIGLKTQGTFTLNRLSFVDSLNF